MLLNLTASELVSIARMCSLYTGTEHVRIRTSSPLLAQVKAWSTYAMTFPDVVAVSHARSATETSAAARALLAVGAVVMARGDLSPDDLAEHIERHTAGLLVESLTLYISVPLALCIANAGQVALALPGGELLKGRVGPSGMRGLGTRLLFSVATCAVSAYAKQQGAT